MAELTPLHRQTSLIRSTALSARHGKSVYLKMETEQPVQSFKIRGVGRLAQVRAASGARALVTSSGGNAGYAVAYAGRRLGLDVEVVVPQSTPEFMRDKLRQENAAVIEHGSSWDDAHAHATEIEAARAGAAAYVHPFDDAEIWRGHASIIQEDAHTAPYVTGQPGAVVVAVGGGGLLCGVLQGMHAVGWSEVPVIAVETEGAASFAAAVEKGELVTLDAIESIATTLGARTVTPEALAWSRRHRITPHRVTDLQALEACRSFYDDHDIWVEPSCGAALSIIGESLPALDGVDDVLVIVCGGAGVNAELIADWEARYR